MKANFYILGLLISLTIISCKNDPKSETETTAKKEAQKIGFVVTLNAIVPKDDNFELFYKEVEQIPYEESTILSTSVKGSPSPQDIVFSINEGEVPNFIRLDYGNNKEQGEIIIKSLKFVYEGKTFEIKDSAFFTYIMINGTNLKADLTKNSLTPYVSKDGSYDPMSYSENTLYNEIQNLVKQ